MVQWVRKRGKLSSRKVADNQKDPYWTPTRQERTGKLVNLTACSKLIQTPFSDSPLDGTIHLLMNSSPPLPPAIHNASYKPTKKRPTHIKNRTRDVDDVYWTSDVEPSVPFPWGFQVLEECQSKTKSSRSKRNDDVAHSFRDGDIFSPTPTQLQAPSSSLISWGRKSAAEPPSWIRGASMGFVSSSYAASAKSQSMKVYNPQLQPAPSTASPRGSRRSRPRRHTQYSQSSYSPPPLFISSPPPFSVSSSLSSLGLDVDPPLLVFDRLSRPRRHRGPSQRLDTPSGTIDMESPSPPGMKSPEDGFWYEGDEESLLGSLSSGGSRLEGNESPGSEFTLNED
jgi:hypothetical protein